jgi:hypothetical protein
MLTSDVEILACKIKSAIPLKLNRNDDLSFSSKALAEGKEFWARLKKSALSSEFVFELQKDNFSVFLRAEQDAGFCCEVREHIRQALISEREAEAEAKQVSLDTGQIFFNDSIPTPLSKLILVENVLENHEAALYDPENDVSYKYAFKSVERHLKRKLGDDLALWFSTNHRHAKFEYRPREERLFKENGHWVLNTYNKPAWMIGHVPNPEIKELRAETLEYLTHLVAGNPDTLQDILYWLKCALYSRAEHTLVLRGVPGCGKNMLAEQLAANLVGCEGEALNYTKGTRNFGSHNFHGNLASACVVLLDEHKLTLEGGVKHTLKDLSNQSAVLEEKNKRIGSPARMSCSFILNTNDKKDVALVMDDRKFFVPDLSNADLQTVRPVEWIDNLAKVLWRDLEYLRDIADYLQFRVTRRKDFTLKTKQFMELCWISQKAYLQSFITLAVTRKTFTKKDLTTDIKPQIVTIKEKVNEYVEAQKLKGGAGVFVQLDKGNWEFTSRIVGRTDLLYLDDRDDETLFVDVEL